MIVMQQALRPLQKAWLECGKIRLTSLVCAASVVAQIFPATDAKTRGTMAARSPKSGCVQSCLTSVSPPDTSTLPGFSSTLIFFTTPSSTSIE